VLPWVARPGVLDAVAAGSTLSLLLVALGAVAAGLTWLHAASALAATVGYNSSLSCRWEGQGALSTTQ